MRVMKTYSQRIYITINRILAHVKMPINNCVWHSEIYYQAREILADHILPDLTMDADADELLISVGF